MIGRCLFLYFVCLAIPLFLFASVWQSVRYTKLEWKLEQMEVDQGKYVEGNKQLMTGIEVLSSPERIEYIVQTNPELGLTKIAPEDVLQIRIEGRGGRDR